MQIPPAHYRSLFCGWQLAKTTLTRAGQWFLFVASSLKTLINYDVSIKPIVTLDYDLFGDVHIRVKYTALLINEWESKSSHLTYFLFFIFCQENL